MFFNPLLARQTLAVSLLHDINHFPLLHTFQEIREEYIQAVDLMDLFCDGKATQDNPSIYDLLGEVSLSREQFKDILFLNIHNSSKRAMSPVSK